MKVKSCEDCGEVWNGQEEDDCPFCSEDDTEEEK